MPSKAKLTTRERTSSNVSSDNFNKGSELSFAEADSNFFNLRDQTFGIAADDSATIDIAAGDTLYIQGGTNVTTATNSDGTITINSTASASTGDLTIATAQVSSQDTVRLTVPGAHDLELNAGAGGGPGGSGDRIIQMKNNVNFHGTLNSDGANGDIDLSPNGSGKIVLDGKNWPTGDGSANQVLITNGSGQLSFASVDNLITTSTFTGDITFNGSTMISPSNADITLDPSGTGEIKLNASVDMVGTARFNTNYKEDIQALSSASTIAVDCSLASVFTVTLAHGATFNFSNLDTGQSVSVIIRQDGSGNRTASFTSVLFPSNQHTLSTGANDIDIISIFNDGTSLLGNISKDYS